MGSKYFFFTGIKISFVTLFLIICNSSNAQIDFTSLEFNLVEENTFQRPITAIVTDQNGFTWIGTDGAGLYRFNGLSYTYYRHDMNDANSINSNTISSMFVDNNKNLWIGTAAGLSRFDEKNNNFQRYDNGVDQYPNILCFAQYGNLLLVGTYNTGVRVVDEENSELKEYIAGDIIVNDLKFNSKGDLYIATAQGLKLRQTQSNNVIVNVALNNKQTVKHITKLLLDERENLWVGTLKSGLFKGNLKKDRGSFQHLELPEGSVKTIASGPNHIFIAVENEGLIILGGDGSFIHHYRHDPKNTKSIGSDSIWSILFDEQNRLWLGYYEDGLGFYDKYQDKFGAIRMQNGQNSIHSNDIKAFAKGGDRKIWIAQINGIDVLHVDTGDIENIYGNTNSPYLGLEEDVYIEDIFIDSKGNAWVATWGNGVFLLEKGSKIFKNFTYENTDGKLQTNKIKCFTEDGNGNIWIGSHLKGLSYFNYSAQTIETPTGTSYTKSNLDGLDIMKLYRDSDGLIWVGTSSGLFHFETKKNAPIEVTSHRDKIFSKFGSHPSSEHILDLFETQDGTLWYGTNGGGLFYFNRNNQEFGRFELEGYDLTYVNAIFEPIKNQLWISSKQGVLKIDRIEKEVIQFTTHDGLLENFIINGAFITDSKNLFYLGTKSGINTIEPQKIAYNPYLAKPYLKDIKLFHKKIDKSAKNGPFNISKDSNVILLNHDQTVLTIDYESISYTRPKKNQYAYLLEGFEEEWNYVGPKTSATYTNLEPGDYRFKLKTSNNDNIWNEASAILKIRVLPPWWKTIWALICYLILLALLILYTAYLYKKRVNLKNTQRLEQERRMQREELQQQKLQFFTNISHEFRTPLTLIINPIKELVQSTTNASFSDPIQQKHKIIHKNAERLSRLINELMDFRKLQSNKLELKVNRFKLIGQIRNIMSFFNEEAKRRNIVLDLKYEDINLEVWADSGMLDKILFNLLSNAFKVTPNGGKIQVKIKANEEKALPLVDSETPIPIVEITVKDNGPGIDQKNYKKIFKRFYQVSELNKSYYGSTGVGLEMVKSFVELHRGIVSVDSKLGKGSIFKIQIPNGRAFFKNLDKSLPQDSDVSDPLLVASEKKQKPYSIQKLLSEKVSKKKVLIVEDNVDLQDYLISILSDEYELLIASDGQEGWLKTMEHKPDIILTDIIMPLMDGIELSKKIKNDSNLSHIPIVMLTAKDLTKDRIKAIKSGADAYIVKPFDTQELTVVLSQLLLKEQQSIKKDAVSASITPEKKQKEIDVDNDFVKRVVGYVQENIENSDMNVESLSSHLCLSRSQVYRKTKTLTGLSPIEFIRRVRLERARTILQKDKNINVSEVAHSVGFLSASYFTVCYKKQFGEHPKVVK